MVFPTKGRISMKKFLCLLLLVCFLAGCAEEVIPAESTVPAPLLNYTLSLHSLGGMPLAEAGIYIYVDSTLADLVAYGATDEHGFAAFSLPENESYTITVSGLPKGYEAESSYRFTGTSAQLQVGSRPIPGESLSGSALTLGDVMPDFSVQTPDGTPLTLSGMLEEKEMVLINFWYTTCTYCVEEFPFMQEAWQEYREDVGIIALNPFEDTAAVQAFQTMYGLEIPMASCPSAWANAFSISGYPTSIVVDRYGEIFAS